jgi:serine/threonine protein kinase
VTRPYEDEYDADEGEGRSSGSPTDDVWEAILERERVNEGQVLLSYADSFRRIGLVDPTEQKLGKGAFGHVYRLGPKDAPTGALKITRDVYDALASYSLIHRDFTRLPKTKRVWALSETFIDDWAGWYAIEREYLHPLDEKDTAAVEVLYQVYDNDKITNLKIPRKRDRAMRDKWRVHAREILDGAGSLNQLPRVMDLLSQIGEGVQELASIGVNWCDIHSDNVMRDSEGTLKISDVGLCDLRYPVESVVVPELVPSILHLPKLSGVR